MAWVSPTGFNDPDSMWSSETKTYDENTVSCATQDGTGCYLELTLGSAIDCNKVRLWGSNAYTIDIDVYYSGDWHNIHSAVIVQDEWNEFSVGSTQSIDKARVKASNWRWDFCEFDFWEVEITPKTSSDSGSGVESSSLVASHVRAETGSGVDAKASGNPLATLVKAESGSGVDALVSLLAVLSSVGETGSGADVSSLLAELVKSESGLGSDLSSLLAELIKGDSAIGIDHLEEQIAEYVGFKLAPYAYGKKRYVRRT